ncbi:MAG: FAD-dependent oxidoreductase [Magnetovibrio sp.]|nr:FAD-dependent oxidoreductase [Magnetovibrio sp.]
MSSEIKCDICIIGAGSGGLSVAAGAAQMGADVVLVEKGAMGGDCLNYGCVPSKALLAAGHAAQGARRTAQFGVSVGDISVDGAKVFDHVRDVIAQIAPNDSVERFEGFGVNVIQGEGWFTGPKTVEADGKTIRAKKYVIATGSSAFVPPITGLDGIDILTNENVFNLDRIPEHLIVVGGGPIGCELAQAFRHLGARVTILEMFKIMPKDDPELVGVVRNRMLADGIEIHEGVRVVQAQGSKEAPQIVCEDEDGREHVVQGSHVLVAAGRRPNVGSLCLERAGIDFSPAGIKVDARLRTSNTNVFAIGDVAGGLQFTHVAGYQAGIVIRNALFKLPAKARHGSVPWVTYTDPELAQVGLTEGQAREQFGDSVKVLSWPFKENDRAQAERQRDGLVKAVVTKKGKILGAGIAGPHAGELIQPWVLAMEQGLKIGALASTIAPYPTLGEVSKRAAGSFYTPSLFSEKTRKIVRFVLKFLS